MNKPDTPPEISNKIPPSYKKQALLVILTFVVLLAIAAVFEALPYFSPDTLVGSNHTDSIRHLPDGTGVLLESGAKLKLGREWKRGGYREVWLQGGARFIVPSVGDTTGLTIHLLQFDVVAQKATLYCFSRKEKGVAWLKEGKAAIITRDAKPKRQVFLPGTQIESTDQRLLTRPVSSDTSRGHME
ncbi:MAG: hypothetical protein INR73_12220 [Williamsia sp.]|nr:hypothetical protein [Williamsia sp.]